MSGGVDSSVVACLLKEQGFNCCGAMMKLFDTETNSVQSEKTCCALADAEDARRVACRLDISFYVFNFTDDFRKEVIERFVNAYRLGMTPNPCIDCNRFVKFERFLRRCNEFELDYIATGHYARIVYDSASKRYLLLKAVDAEKDQSYVLYAMTQQQLAKTLFPLGHYRKQEVREIAKNNGLTNALKKESQDLCFVPDGDYAAFIERYTGQICPAGDFVDKTGKILGKQHKGLIRYTIGQRKGLGIAAPAPYYVCGHNIENNTVILGSESDLRVRTVTATDINFIPFDQLDRPFRGIVKVRYRQKGDLATVSQIDSDTIKIEFDEPQKGVANGQAAVLYDGDYVIGGGTIVAAE